MSEERVLEPNQEGPHPPAISSPFRDDDLDRPLERGDPNRMKLTKQEYENAMAIKEMVEGLHDLDNLSDFMYAQFAIVCKDDLEDVLQRCYAMQDFREEYKIVNNYEQGCRYLQEGVKLFPTQYLSLSFSSEEGRYIFLHDVEKFEPKAFTNADLVDDWIRMQYYLHVLFFPDLEAIRKGIVILVDCKDIGFRRDRMKYFKLLFDTLLSFFPHAGQCRMFHTGTIMNTIASLLRKLLPPEMKDNFQVGFQYDGDMGKDFLTPTVEEANRRIIARMKNSLELRYENEKTFSLEEIEL